MNKIPIKGKLKYTLYDKEGEVKNSGDFPNTVTELLDAHVADQMSDQGDSAIGFMALGSGTGQGAGDTDLSNYITDSIIALSGTSPIQGAGGADNDIVYSAYWAAGAGTGSVREAGIFLGSATSRADLMFYNDAITVNKGASDTLKIDWTATFGAS